MSSEHALWEHCWQQLDAAFTATADNMRNCNPKLWAKSGWRESEVWPFNAWIEFCRVRNPTRTEDIVVFVAVKREAGVFSATMDISTGEGEVLADGPSQSFAVDSFGKWEHKVTSFIKDCETFLGEQIELLRTALC